MIQTRGGWQDQVGGLWGGIKLCTTRPGVHQVPHVAPIAAPPAFIRALHERAVLLYSGRRRMARDILETVVLRYLRGEHAVMDARARLVAALRPRATSTPTNPRSALRTSTTQRALASTARTAGTAEPSAVRSQVKSA
jgi:hypothetical protein